MTQAQLGFVRALGIVIITAVLGYLGDASNLNGVVSTSAAAIISGIALSLEHYMAGKKPGSALFGAATVK